MSKEQKKKPLSLISEAEREVLLEVYDKDQNNAFSDDEIVKIIADYNENRETCDPRVVKILDKYCTTGKGVLQDHEIHLLKHHLEIGDTNARYVGYVAALVC